MKDILKVIGLLWKHLWKMVAALLVIMGVLEGVVFRQVLKGGKIRCLEDLFTEGMTWQIYMGSMVVFLFVTIILLDRNVNLKSIFTLPMQRSSFYFGSMLYIFGGLSIISALQIGIARLCYVLCKSLQWVNGYYFSVENAEEMRILLFPTIENVCLVITVLLCWSALGGAANVEKNIFLKWFEMGICLVSGVVFGVWAARGYGIYLPRVIEENRVRFYGILVLVLLVFCIGISLWKKLQLDQIKVKEQVLQPAQKRGMCCVLALYGAILVFFIGYAGGIKLLAQRIDPSYEVVQGDAKACQGIQFSSYMEVGAMGSLLFTVTDGKLTIDTKECMQENYDKNQQAYAEYNDVKISSLKKNKAIFTALEQCLPQYKGLYEENQLDKANAIVGSEVSLQRSQSKRMALEVCGSKRLVLQDVDLSGASSIITFCPLDSGYGCIVAGEEQITVSLFDDNGVLLDSYPLDSVLYKKTEKYFIEDLEREGFYNGFSMTDYGNGYILLSIDAEAYGQIGCYNMVLKNKENRLEKAAEFTFDDFVYDNRPVSSYVYGSVTKDGKLCILYETEHSRKTQTRIGVYACEEGLPVLYQANVDWMRSPVYGMHTGWCDIKEGA